MGRRIAPAPLGLDARATTSKRDEKEGDKATWSSRSVGSEEEEEESAEGAAIATKPSTATPARARRASDPGGPLPKKGVLRVFHSTEEVREMESPAMPPQPAASARRRPSRPAAAPAGSRGITWSDEHGLQLTQVRGDTAEWETRRGGRGVLSAQSFV